MEQMLSFVEMFKVMQAASKLEQEQNQNREKEIFRTDISNETPQDAVFRIIRAAAPYIRVCEDGYTWKKQVIRAVRTEVNEYKIQKLDMLEKMMDMMEMMKKMKELGLWQI